MKPSASGLIIPASVTSTDPKYLCRICGAKFYEEEREKWQGHVVRCARRNRDELRVMAADELKPLIPVSDPERQADIIKHRRVR